MENKFLQFIYTFFLGGIIALFIGLGIHTFYPKPSYEANYNYNSSSYNSDYQVYQAESETHDRNVSIIALVISVLLLAASVFLEKSNRVIANGVLLGGTFLLLYSMGSSFATNDSVFSFIIVGIGLAIVLYIGHHRFTTNKPAKKVKRSNQHGTHSY